MAGWSVATLVALLLLPWFSVTEASHFRGGIIMAKPDPSNDFTTRFAFRMAFRRSYSFSYYCDQIMKDSGAILGSGDYWNRECTNYTDNPLCSSEFVASTGFHCTDFSIVEDWSMGGNNFTYTFPANVHNLWTVSYTSCCWISLAKGGNSDWILSTVVNLTRRADTGEINSSPITTNQAIVRLREGCAQSIRIPLKDPDGDVVRCRWSYFSESYQTRDSFPHAGLDEATCILTYHGGSGSAGTYAVALTLEDFPAGTTDFVSVRPLSSVGLQFLVIINASHSGSCDSKPVFTGSTPQDGQCAEIQIGFAYTATVQVTHVDHSQQIVELTTFSPSGMHFSSLSRNELVYSSNIIWSPSQYQAGKQVFCFKAVDSSGIESDTRCVTILVGLNVNECGAHPRSRRNVFLPWDSSSSISPTSTYSEATSVYPSSTPSSPEATSVYPSSTPSSPEATSVYPSSTPSPPGSCSFYLTDSSGNFSSPNFSSSYDNNHHCTWLISVPSGYYVYLNFNHFSLEGAYCGFDYVDIFDGNSTAAPKILKRCGYYSPWCVYSSGNVLFVRLVTAGSVTPTGFSAHYETVSNISENCHHLGNATITPSAMTPTTEPFSPPPSNGSCSFYLTDSYGKFSSPNYPQNYSNGHYCTWLINASPGHYVNLYFHHFNLEYEGNHCPYDYVDIFDGNSTSAPRILKRCGYHSPWCVYSNGNVLLVRLITDSIVTGPGFSAYYETVSYICTSPDDSTTPSMTPTTSPFSDSPSSSPPNDIIDNRGKEFLVSFLPQHPQLRFNGTDRLYLSSFEDTRARVQAPFLAIDTWYDVPAGNVRHISLPGTARADSFTGKEKKGIRITSDKPISVHGIQVMRYSGEGFLGLPMGFLGTEYMVPTFQPAINAIVQVVAGEDNTIVQFHLRLPPGQKVSYDNVDYGKGDVLNVTLSNLEIFHVMAPVSLSGTRVTSSKPIAVFSGNDCAMVPNMAQPCNHLVEQIPPITYWGNDFITSPVVENQAGDAFLVLASKSNTVVSVNGQMIKVLNEGETYEPKASVNQSLVITTSYPSLVVQYHNGLANRDSPFMALVPPTTWFSNDYTIYTPNDFKTYINIVIDTSKRNGLRIQGSSAPQVNGWKVIPSSGFSWTALRFSQPDAVYHVFHVNPLTNFSLVLHGKASRKWFAFPAGLKLLRYNPSCSPTGTTGGDEIDNDCDGLTDEELANGLDDDNDGRVDEDLATPVPNVNIPKNISVPPLLSCGSSSDVANPSKIGKATFSAQGLCKLRGTPTSSYKDNILSFQNCIQEIERVWTIEDDCENVIKRSQLIRIKIAHQAPKIVFPGDVTMTCREREYLQPVLTGEVQVTASCRNTKVSFQDTVSDCEEREGRVTRTWTVEDECRKRKEDVQIIKLLPKGTRRTKNYVLLFRITNASFSDELKDSSSSAFKTLASDLNHEMKEKFMHSEFGRLFVAAQVIQFSNGSVVPRMLVKMDALANVDQRKLVGFMNNTLKNGTLGNSQVDPSSVRIEDFDECQDSKLNDCHEKAICTNTLGSYNCACREGYFGNGTVCQSPPSIFYHDPPVQAGTEENVTLTCQADGLPAPKFSWITPQGVVNSTSAIIEYEVLDDDNIRKRGKVLQDDGSLLVFNTRVHDQGIYECVAKNVMGEDKGSVNLTIRKDIVEVDAAITIKDRTFDEDLENKSSIKYQAMEEEVKEELELLFQDIEGFERVEILGFMNGSVKVRFRVVIRVDKPEDKEPEVVATKIGKTLKVSVKNGRVGKLVVTPAVELKEIPPPPIDIKASDIKETEAVIGWSHPELHGMFDISGYLLQYKKFGTTKWMTFTTTRGDNHILNDLQHGTAYSVRLKSENPLGIGDPSEDLELLTLEKKSSAGLVLAILLPIIILIILAIAAFFLYRRWKNKAKRRGYAEEAVPMNPMTPEQMAQPQVSNRESLDRYAPVPGTSIGGTNGIQIEATFSWREIPRERVILGKILGEGEFGMVVKGEITDSEGKTSPCAVKRLKRTATESDLKDLLNELEIMTQVGKHPNLVNLIGACAIGGPLMIVVEFAEHGNLLNFLRERRKQNYEDMNQYTLEISSSERLRIACDISSGMKHLAKMKCAHRDLAARNVLLGEGMVAKVSDFGLSRDIYTDNVYEKKSGGKLPAKWMAIESLEFGINTSQSDVWSFGVLLWEIETGGTVPYAGSVVNELLSRLKQGHRLDKPRYCSDYLFALMSRCWNANPKERPTFEDLGDELQQMLKQETDYLAPEEWRLEPEYMNTVVENASSA